MALQIGTRGNNSLLGTASNYVLIGDPQRSAALILASSTVAGAPGNAGSFAPSYLPDGRSVVFVSASDNLIPNDSNLGYNVYLKDLLTEIKDFGPVLDVCAVSTNTATGVHIQVTAADATDLISFTKTQLTAVNYVFASK